MTQPLQNLGAISVEGPQITLMEICGTHTVSIFRSGIRSLLPKRIKLISGPGCPVCVTSAAYFDKAIWLLENTDCIITTFGDMLKVPGSNTSLNELRKTMPHRVKMVYSSLESIEIAEKTDKPVVFLGVGFETTAPTVAASIQTAAEKGIKNFSVLNACKTIPEAMRALLSADDLPLDGFILPGHVSAIIGVDAYQPIVEEFSIPSVVCSFEPASMYEGIQTLIRLVEAKQPELQNSYPAVVTAKGNPVAQALLAEIFEEGDVHWRGLGVIPKTGLLIRQKYQQFDTEHLYPNLREITSALPSGCRCGEVLTGRISPPDCALYGTCCTPKTPIGPCMVSSEGTCGAWFRYAE